MGDKCECQTNVVLVKANRSKPSQVTSEPSREGYIRIESTSNEGARNVDYEVEEVKTAHTHKSPISHRGTHVASSVREKRRSCINLKLITHPRVQPVVGLWWVCGRSVAGPCMAARTWLV